MEIDDVFVVSEDSHINLNKMLPLIKLYREDGVDKTYISNSAYSLSYDRKIEFPALFRKGEVVSSKRQEIWYRKFYVTAINSLQLIESKKYKGISLTDIQAIAQLSRHPKSVEKAYIKLFEMGILLLFIEAPSGSKIDGAVFQPNDSVIVVGLSLRFHRIDYFWFTLLHELAHIYAHSAFLKEGIISEEECVNEIEGEANRIAKDCIISKSAYRTSVARRTFLDSDLFEESRKANIHPALLAGLIRRDLNQYNVFSNIVNRESIWENI